MPAKWSANFAALVNAATLGSASHAVDSEVACIEHFISGSASTAEP
jgi:hypothetical protein